MNLLARPNIDWLDISRGLDKKTTSLRRYGRNSLVDGTFVPISLGGIYRTPQTATTLRIKAGGNASDTFNGSGARKLLLEGLDENFLEVTDTLITNGASASSPTTKTFTRLFEVRVLESGTYATSTAGSHAGSITIENGAGGTNWATIDATTFPKGRTEIGAYSIPLNKKGVVLLKSVSVDSGKTIDFVFFSRSGINKTIAPYDAMVAQSAISGVASNGIMSFGASSTPLAVFDGGTDIGFMATFSNGTASVSVEFEIFLIDE